MKLPDKGSKVLVYTSLFGKEEVTVDILRLHGISVTNLKGEKYFVPYSNILEKKNA